METAIGKAIDLVCEYTVVPISRQFQYVFCYKSFISDMQKASHDLENDKKLIEQSVDEARNNLQVISAKATEWLKEVDGAHTDVTDLSKTYEQDQAGKCSCFGQILNPIARHQHGRRATKKKLDIEQLVLTKPKVPEDICYAPPPSGIVNQETAAAAAAARSTDNGVFQSSCWNEAINRIMEALKDDTTKIVGLHGMGGVGKSTMINEVHLRVLEQCMFDEVAKVEVKAEVDIARVQEEIASALGLTLKKSSEAVRARLLSNRLLKTDQKDETDDEKKKTKKKKSVLIILDDLWEKLELGRVGIPSGNDQVQIKLLLTSRDEHLLSDRMGARDPIPLDVLNDADALRMFKRVVGLGDEDKGEKARKAAEIAPKCSGLPVVIMAIANALKNRVLKEWEDVLQKLDVTDALSKLEVSYDHLPSEESKRLFLMCGIIRGPRIQVSDLLKYTFGLGFYEEKDIHTLAAAATELDKLLSGLEAASMLLKRDDSHYVRIHDRMRDLAVKIVKRYRHEWAHFTLRDERCEIPRRFDASKLELILSSCEESDSQLQVPDSFFQDMKNLYVLEFTNLNGGFSLLSTTGHLQKLETLCLHKCSLSDISMIGELKGLRILSFQGSDIRKIPIQLGRLVVLKMLDLSNCTKLTEIEPNVLGSLTKLEELNMENSFKDWEIDQEDDARPPSNSRLIELRNMSRLSNVKIHIPNTSMLPKDDQLFSSKLTVYKIMLGGDWNWDIMDDYRKESKVLMLQFDDSPNVLQLDWVQATLQRTEILLLNGSLDGKCESIDELCAKGFECLKHLEVSKCPSIRYIASSNSGSNFSDLESFYLEKLENLEKLYNGETFSSKLGVTEVNRCNRLTHLFDFSVLKCNLELEEIIIRDCKEIHCIVIDEDDKNDDVVKLSKLQTLKLRRLPKFQAFCVPQGSQPTMKALFSGRKVAFPCLESLVIDELDELEDIWHPTDPPTELGKLRSLRVKSCDKLVRVINSNVLMKLEQHLEVLKIDCCASVEHLFDVEDDTIVSGTIPRELSLFCKVKQLLLLDMDRLKSISKNLMIGRDCVLTIFPNIKSLYVYSCPDLRYVLSSSLLTGVGALQLPTEIFLSECDKVEAIIAVMVRGEETQQAAIQYSSLKRLVVWKCNKLKTFSWYYSCGKSDENMVASTEYYNIISSTSQQDPVALPFFSQKEIFPCLETLDLQELKELRQIWPHEVVAAQGSFNNLKEVEIQSCPKLSEVFPSTLIECLQKLESIKVGRCELMQSMIVNHKNIKPTLEIMEAGQHDQAIVHGSSSNSKEAAPLTMEIMKFTFPCLRELVFFYLPKLDRFDSSSSASVDFPSLETLRMISCPKVKALFIQRPNGVETAFFGYGDKQAKSIPKLKLLELSQLLGFTGIWQVGRSDDESCSDSIVELQQKLFWIQNLESLTMEALPKLKDILAPLGATSLAVHLTEEKEEGVDNENGGEEEEEEEGRRRGDIHREMLTFNHLKKLKLEYLKNLESFSSSSSVDLNFPSLEKLTICGCRNMRIFSNGGILTTPNLDYVKWNGQYHQLTEDLNTTIQKKYASGTCSR